MFPSLVVKKRSSVLRHVTKFPAKGSERIRMIRNEGILWAIHLSSTILDSREDEPECSPLIILFNVVTERILNSDQASNS